MSIVPMTKVQLLSHRKTASAVLETAQMHGALHFTDITNTDLLTQSEKQVFEFDYYASRLDFAVSFLTRYENTSMLKTMFEGRRVKTNRTEIEKTVNSFYFNDVIATVQNLERNKNNLEAKQKERVEEKALLEQWRNLGMSLDTPTTTAYTQSYTINGTPTSLSDLEQAIEDEDAPIALTRIGENTAVLTAHHDNRDHAIELISEYKLESTALPKRRGTPAEEIERIERADIKTEKHIKVIHEQARRLTEHLPKLRIIADYIHWKKNKHDVLADAYHTSSVAVFEGWCPTNKLDTLRETLTAQSKHVALEEIEPGADEQPPVELKNRGVVEPFESITRLYGVPGYADIDPTLFLAGFFFIFFGLSLTDVGYGIIMFTLTALVLWRYTTPEPLRLLLKLLMFGGLASSVIGLFFGGYFGIDPRFLPGFLQHMQLFDPINNPLPIFYLSLVLGFIQVVFGFILKIVREAKNGDLTGGLLDQIPWLLLFLSIALGIGNVIGMYTLPAHTTTTLVVISLLSIVATQGRAENGVLTKTFKGTLSLYDFIGYFSDVLSYSRLLALGLATSALAFSVNMIGTLVADLIPYIGTVLMVAVLVVGHIFTLLVNALGAFIHSARLQFVEFFGKFIEGTGTEFAPFSQEERNVIVQK